VAGTPDEESLTPAGPPVSARCGSGLATRRVYIGDLLPVEETCF